MKIELNQAESPPQTQQGGREIRELAYCLLLFSYIIIIPTWNDWKSPDTNWLLVLLSYNLRESIFYFFVLRLFPKEIPFRLMFFVSLFLGSMGSVADIYFLDKYDFYIVSAKAIFTLLAVLHTIPIIKILVQNKALE